MGLGTPVLQDAVESSHVPIVHLMSISEKWSDMQCRDFQTKQHAFKFSMMITHPQSDLHLITEVFSWHKTCKYRTSNRFLLSYGSTSGRTTMSLRPFHGLLGWPPGL